MKLMTFKGGIHPPENKHYTETKPIRTYMPKGYIVFPMSQHIGSPCDVLVKRGERVLVGQTIGAATSYVSSPIISSVSGTVKKIEDVLTVSGSKSKAIIVENDGLYEEVDHINKPYNFEAMTNEEILEVIKNSGIVGLGGATFPTHVKLNPPKDKKIDAVIVNGAECEPYLTSDHRIMLEETDRVLKGLTVILKLFPDAKGYVGIESNKQDAIKKMMEEAKKYENITVVPLKTKYPQGAEKQLIYSITKRKVPAGKLPSEVGCVVQNIDTVVAIHRAFFRGRPLMRRIITVSGDCIKNPGNYKVRIGTSYRELIEEAGGFVKEPVKFISGGSMMGMAMFSLDVPIIKGSSSILCLSEDELHNYPEENCIRCTKCINICPMNLLPNQLNKYSNAGDFDLFEKIHGLDCIECGACSYTCPSHRHLLQSIRTAKKTVLANKRKG